jgi:hypothetical protein
MWQCATEKYLGIRLILVKGLCATPLVIEIHSPMIKMHLLLLLGPRRVHFAPRGERLLITLDIQLHIGILQPMLEPKLLRLLQRGTSNIDTTSWCRQKGMKGKCYRELRLEQLHRGALLFPTATTNRRDGALHAQGEALIALHANVCGGRDTSWE